MSSVRAHMADVVVIVFVSFRAALWSRGGEEVRSGKKGTYPAAG